MILRKMRGEEDMDTNEILNICILILQAIILFGQLSLSQKINEQTISKEKGYFLIEQTNMLVIKGDEGRFRDVFDLKSKRGIGFQVVRADIILCSCNYSVNGVTYKIGQPVDGFFTEDNRFNKFMIFIDLRESDFQKEDLDIEIVFNLKNTVGYKYTEIVNIRFSKNENGNLYRISKYNMVFNK